MGIVEEGITGAVAEWIQKQHVFFVASAPLSPSGHVNCSPKGMDTFRVLGPREVAYLDLTGSGIETIAHVRENGRIVIMFCAFEGAPKILRLYGTAQALVPGDSKYAALRPQFPEVPGERALLHVNVTRVMDSCGFGVPLMNFHEDRQVLVRSAESKGPQGLAEYRAKKNRTSLDGLPGFPGLEG